MQDEIRRLEDKLDRVAEDIVDIKVTMARNTQSLEEHMRRSLANEEAIDILKQEVKPIEEHVVYVNRAVRHVVSFIKTTASIATVVGTVIAILSFLHSLGLF